MNKNTTKYYSRALIFIFIVMSGMGFFSCKSAKKKAEEQAAEAQARKIAKAKADLEELLSNTSGLAVEERERRLNYIKGMNIDDPEIQVLISEVEQSIANERKALAEAEKLKKQQEERLKRETVSENKDLDDYFVSISRADDAKAADKYINEALKLFESDEAPVLIIVSKSGDIVDYDRPTTIRRYLEYLKDRKVIANEIENIIYNSDGKIAELELIKK